MVIGVDQLFSKTLELKGVGYKAFANKTDVTLNLGYSHPISLLTPDGIEVSVENNTVIHVKGIDKEQVGLFAQEIRSKRPPEPYKGKGVLYKGETIIRKVGKSSK
jgi:large subunit ribosomal protein L6